MTLGPGLGVTGKIVLLQVMTVEMGEVASRTFLPLWLLLLLVVFRVDIQFAFGGGSKIAGQTIVLRLSNFVMFFVPVIS